MHSAVFFGRWYSLDPVYARLVTHFLVNILVLLAFDFKTSFFVAVQVAFGFIIHPPLPTLRFGKFFVHMRQLPSKKAGFIPARSRPHFHHYFISHLFLVFILFLNFLLFVFLNAPVLLEFLLILPPPNHAMFRRQQASHGFQILFASNAPAYPQDNSYGGLFLILRCSLFLYLSRSRSALIETIYPSSRIHYFFITGIERVTLATNLHGNLSHSGTNFKNSPAGASGFRFYIVFWMDIFFHLVRSKSVLNTPT